jgi:choline kinase
MGRPMLDWVLEALEQGGVARKDVVFVSGYAEDKVRARYPELTFVRNRDWQNNNILLSLLTAHEFLVDGFIATYSDIVYEPAIVTALLKSPHAIALGCDTEWRRRYKTRSQHPESDAEKLRALGSRVLELGRTIDPDRADGEFIGVLKLTSSGADEFLRAFDDALAAHSGQLFREGRRFEKAYLIDLLQHMLERGSTLHRENTRGGYMEIDTLEDLSMAETWWRSRP